MSTPKDVHFARLYDNEIGYYLTDPGVPLTDEPPIIAASVKDAYKHFRSLGFETAQVHIVSDE